VVEQADDDHVMRGELSRFVPCDEGIINRRWDHLDHPIRVVVTMSSGCGACRSR
jgi:hypothetical protein